MNDGDECIACKSPDTLTDVKRDYFERYWQLAVVAPNAELMVTGHSLHPWTCFPRYCPFFNGFPYSQSTFQNHCLIYPTGTWNRATELGIPSTRPNPPVRAGRMQSIGCFPPPEIRIGHLGCRRVNRPSCLPITLQDLPLSVILCQHCRKRTHNTSMQPEEGTLSGGQREQLGSRSNNNFEMSHSAVQVPEPMVMHRANGSVSTLGSSSEIEATGGSAHSFTMTNSVGSADVYHPRMQSGEDHKGGQGGLLASGMAYFQRRNERRRRVQLQHQAEEQLRKIVQAERDNNASHNNQHHSLNSHSGSIIHTIGSNSSGDDHSDDSAIKIGTPHLSKSGEGASAQLELDLDDEDENFIPKVRIHVDAKKHRRNNSNSSNFNAEGSESFDAPSYLLTPDQMHHVAIHVLPRTIAYCQWRLLYSLERDGDSFEGCLRLISNVKRTLMVVRTTRGAVFGGYADDPWRSTEFSHARFYGSAQACLFSVIDPSNQNCKASSAPLSSKSSSKSTLLNVYKWTGKNRYIQLCDMSHKMIAFGGGGVEGAFGVAVQEDFQTGSTGHCDTFDNDPLCNEETFDIVSVEFWEFLTGVF